MVRKSKKKIVQTETEEEITAASTLLIKEMDEIGDTKNQIGLLCDDDPAGIEDADLLLEANSCWQL